MINGTMTRGLALALFCILIWIAALPFAPDSTDAGRNLPQGVQTGGHEIRSGEPSCTSPSAALSSAPAELATLSGRVSFAGLNRGIAHWIRLERLRPWSAKIDGFHESEILTTSDPSFLFENLTPGEYGLSMKWKGKQGGCCFQRRLCLGPGQYLDLGDMHCHLEGETMAFLVRFVGEDGRHLDPEQVLPRGGPGRLAHVTLQGPVDSSSSDQLVGEIYHDFEAGSVNQLHGLAPGRWRVILADPELRGSQFQMLSQPVGPRAQEVILPSNTPVEFQIPIIKNHRRISLNFLAPARSREHHLIWARRSLADTNEDGPHWFAFAEVVIDHSTETIDLPVLEGIDVPGLVTDSTGQLKERCMVSFNIDEYQGWKVPGDRPYSCFTDGEGQFLLKGVPENSRLRHVESGQRFWTSRGHLLRIQLPPE